MDLSTVGRSKPATHAVASSFQSRLPHDDKELPSVTEIQCLIAATLPVLTVNSLVRPWMEIMASQASY
jgi:hypothetical protein